LTGLRFWEVANLTQLFLSSSSIKYGYSTTFRGLLEGLNLEINSENKGLLSGGQYMGSAEGKYGLMTLTTRVVTFKFTQFLPKNTFSFW